MNDTMGEHQALLGESKPKHRFLVSVHFIPK